MSKPPSDMSEWQRLKTRSTRKIAFVHLPRLQQPKAGRKRPNYPRFRDFNAHFRVFPLNRSWAERSLCDRAHSTMAYVTQPTP